MHNKINDYIDKVINEAGHVSFDLDEVYHDVEVWDKKNMFQLGLELFDRIADELISLNIVGVMAQIQFPLTTRSKKIKPAPLEQTVLVSMLDVWSMPEIIIHFPKKKIWLPKLEMYFCPLPFKLEALRNTYHALYEQYREPRIYDEIGDLVSWLTITYHNEK